MELPLYELFIDLEDESGVDFIALVDDPAIKKNWQAFKADSSKFTFKADKEKRIISGAAMVANLPIYRRRKDGSEYYVMFKAETIKSVVEKFFRNQYSNNFNIMHRKNLLADGVYLIESMIIDSERGIKTPLGFEELSEGSWFISCKVDNDKVWDDYIKTGVFNGFSVEGEFIEKKISHANKQLDEILAILEKVR
jgi:hypothetical protein